MSFLKRLSHYFFRPDVINERMEKIEGELLKEDQINCPVENYFAPGIYARQVTLPTGKYVIGHQHRKNHLNIVISGRAKIMCGVNVFYVKAGDVFTSDESTRKLAYIEDDLVFITVHATNQTNPKKLEKELIKKSSTFYSFLKSKTLTD